MIISVNVSAVNASYLGKNGAVTILFKILGLCQRKHLILLKHSLDSLGHLVKSSQCYLVSYSLSVSRVGSDVLNNNNETAGKNWKLLRLQRTDVHIEMLRC